MQVCTLLQTHNHASIPTLSFLTDRMPFLSSNQYRQSTEGKKSEKNLQIMGNASECFCASIAQMRSLQCFDAVGWASGL